MTRRRLTCAALLILGLAASFALAQQKRAANDEPLNLDLEQGGPGGVPEGWVSTRYNEKGGYGVELVEGGAKSGERCARIVKETQPDQQFFGNLMQVVDATAYRGKRIRFRAWVRTDFEDRMSRAQLWLRVDREQGRGFFDNMGDRPIATDSWKQFEIVGDVADDAEDINFGMILVGRGTAWMDAASIEVVGKPGEGNLPPRTLKGRALDNLVAFTRLLGYVRHFHPTEAVARADWNEIAIRGVQVVEPAKDATELAALLETLFRPLAPTLRVFPSGSEPPLPPELSAPAEGSESSVVYWRHMGVGLGNERSIYSSRIVGAEGDDPTGNEAALVRQIDATPYRGKRVRFSAAVRAQVSGAGHYAALGMRVLTPSGMAFHDEMADRPILSADWERYEIVGEVADDAHTIYVGLGLIGAGSAWYDEVELTVVDGDVEGTFVPSGFEADDPGEAPGDWQFMQAAPEISYETAVTDQKPHRGRRSARITGKRGESEVPSPDEPFRAGLEDGVSCIVPLALYASSDAAAGSTPDGVGGAERPDGWIPSGKDRASRLAAVVLAWNVFQHFYPYFDVVEADWPHTLRRSLEAAAVDESELDFLDTLRRLVADIHDGHGRVTHSSDTSSYRVPVLWSWIEEHLVVTYAAEEGAEGLRPGDVVVAVDGRPAGEALAELERTISGATPQWRRHRALAALGMGAHGSKIELLVRGAEGAERTVKLSPSTPLWGEGALAEPRPETVSELEEGILYVNLGRIEDAAFTENVERMAQAKGLVFDMRGYPRFNFTSVVAHLIDEPVTSAQWHVPTPARPDREGMGYHFSNWTVQPKQPRFRGKVAFLTHGGAISAAETFMGIIEHYGLGEIVGSATAGTNGNVNSFSVPGGYGISWTGMRVLKHDGSQHHGIGILPTIPSERTIRGVREGRDEQLERAVEVVKGAGD